MSRIAFGLGPLVERVVFLGGAVTPMLVTDPGAAPPRPTLDVDVIVKVATSAEYGRLREELVGRGFGEDTAAGAPICRWVFGDLMLDVMPSEASILGFSNSWYPTAIADRVRHALPGGPDIWLVSGPCFLATKLEAFRGRGHGDYRASHDLEDLLVVVDGRPAIEAEVLASGDALRKFISAEVAALLGDRAFAEALAGHLPGDAASQARVPRLKARLMRLAGA